MAYGDDRQEAGDDYEALRGTGVGGGGLTRPSEGQGVKSGRSNFERTARHHGEGGARVLLSTGASPFAVVPN